MCKRIVPLVYFNNYFLFKKVKFIIFILNLNWFRVNKIYKKYQITEYYFIFQNYEWFELK
jgi:hypothetical protein